MMNARENLHEAVLDRLNGTVIEAAAYLATADEKLSDGRQTAHGVLAQLVFWHEQYVKTARALLGGRTPELKSGSFERLNQAARTKYASDSMTMLAYDLSSLQKEFDTLVRQLPDWSIDFPIKQDSTPCTLMLRLEEIESHIRQHVLRLKKSSEEQ
jgi:hypothetical protein